MMMLRRFGRRKNERFNRERFLRRETIFGRWEVLTDLIDDNDDDLVCQCDFGVCCFVRLNLEFHEFLSLNMRFDANTFKILNSPLKNIINSPIHIGIILSWDDLWNYFTKQKHINPLARHDSDYAIYFCTRIMNFFFACFFFSALHSLLSKERRLSSFNFV